MSATACFLHAHAVSQGRFRCASRRARLLDTSHRRRLQTQRVGKAARGVLTTDAMNHLESFRSCISCCRLPAFAPIHSPCPEWSSATCPCNGPLHMFSTSCVMSCVSSSTLRSPRPRMPPRVCLWALIKSFYCIPPHSCQRLVVSAHNAMLCLCFISMCCMGD